ncbi:MAG: NAD(P)-dependent oxidoreductase [Parachlamydiales bacterium]|jgi:glyoxylate reductase
MLKKKVYLTRKLPPIAKELLKSRFFSVEENPGPVLASADLKRALEENDAILTTFVDRIGPELLKMAKVKVISNYATGLDNIDTKAAEALGIKVFNTPDIVTDSTADLTLALLLGFCRRLAEAGAFIQAGWKEWDPEVLVGEELRGKTLGLLGLGRIGRAVAERARPFGLKILYYQRFAAPASPDFQRALSLEELLAASDYLSLHVPLTPQTLGLIDWKAFQKMKKKPLILNLARGPVIKTDDLVRALQEGLIRGAALDVSDPEPLPSGHPLLNFKNCLITPHLGTSTFECRRAMAQKAAENILQFYA